MDFWTRLYEGLPEIAARNMWQDIYGKFYQAWFQNDRWLTYLQGLGTTLQVTVIALCIGIVLGVLVAVVRTAHDQRRPGTWNPVLGTMVGALALGINSGAYVSEIIRGGLMALDPGQSEAGRSLGLTYFDTMRFIVIPQAFKAILPSLGNEFIVLLKDTSLISVIAGKEIVYFARAIITRTYEPMFPYLITAAMYLIMVLLFSWLQGKLERRLRESDRR